MKVILGLIFLFNAFYFKCLSQPINIHSITNQRQPNAGGYTLDGYDMVTSSRLKLLNTTNFGTAGVYSKSVNIVDGFAGSNSLTQVVNFPYTDLFFFGTFDKSDNTLVQFTNEEIDSLYNWSTRGGRLIICGSSSLGVGGFDPTVLNSKWGFQITKVYPSSFIPNSIGLTTDIFNGPFGLVDSAQQGGAAQGHFSSLPSNVSVLATDVNNNPTIIMDCTTLDLIVADVDGYTNPPGALSIGSTITNDQDKYWANSIVFMDKLQPTPTINLNGFNLSTANIYNGYQWYKNDTSIIGSIGSSTTINKQGQYYVEVTMNGGCKVKSNIIIANSALTIKENITAFDNIKVFPNPSQNLSTVEYTLPQGVDKGEIIIYDIKGEEIKRVTVNSSSSKIELNNSALQSGTYFCQLKTSKGSVGTKKMVVIK